MQYWRGSGAFSARQAVTDKTPLGRLSEISFFDRPRCSAAAVDERTAEQARGRHPGGRLRARSDVVCADASPGAQV